MHRHDAKDPLDEELYDEDNWIESWTRDEAVGIDQDGCNETGDGD